MAKIEKLNYADQSYLREKISQELMSASNLTLINPIYNNGLMQITVDDVRMDGQSLTQMVNLGINKK